MRSLRMRCGVLGLCLMIVGQSAAGGERPAGQVIAVAPFAVPVGVPVAVVQPGGVLYAYRPLGAGLDGAREVDARTEALWREFEAFRRWREGERGAAVKETHVSAVANACAKCHAGNTAKGNVRLDGSLNGTLRLAALKAVITGEMPKGVKLSADEREGVLKELAEGSGQRAVEK